MAGRNKGGRPRLSAEEKVRRGTLRPVRERMSTASERSEATDQTSQPIADRPYVEIANGYRRDVLAGRIVACQWVRLACERQDRDLKRADDPSWRYRWDDGEAAAICRFAESCPHVEGTWDTPLVHLEPIEVFLLTTIFGWRRKADGWRRFSTVYIEVARKFGKSILSAIVMLYCLRHEREVGAQIRIAATTGAQARIVFGVMQKMIRRSAALRELGLRVFANAILHDEDGGGDAQPINSKSSTQDGLNPSAYCVDELHAHRDRGLFDVLKSSRGARRNPLSWYITTAGYDQLGVAYEQRTFVTKVLQGVFTAEHYFGIIFTLDEGDEWTDERVWVKANPMLGITPQIDEMRQYCQEAKDSPASEAEFKTKRLNLWLTGASSWLNLSQWDACADPSMRLDDFRGELACIGGDLAQKDDLAALAIAFERGGVVYGFLKFYLPRLVVEQRARAVPAYRLWADQGLLTLTEGNTLDEAAVEADVRQWCEQFDIRAIAFDQFGSAGITTRLASDGLPAVLTPKNAKTFTEPSRELEVRVRQGLLRHDGNAILRWNASNVCVTRRADDSLLPKKDHPDSPNKIDGIDGLLLAMGSLRRTIAEGDTSRSVWEDDSYEMVTL